MKPTKLIIEVTAGVLPEEPIDKYTKRWSLSAEEVEDMEHRQAAEGAAMLYALGLHRPRELNWVRQDWILL